MCMCLCVSVFAGGQVLSANASVLDPCVLLRIFDSDVCPLSLKQTEQKMEKETESTKSSEFPRYIFYSRVANAA